jgi:hypothetical protein
VRPGANGGARPGYSKFVYASLTIEQGGTLRAVGDEILEIEVRGRNFSKNGFLTISGPTARATQG